LTHNGADPIRIGDGSTRSFLEDGDEVVLRGRAGDVSLGEVRGTVVATVDQDTEGNGPAR
jgi:fumarylacetoacetase